jgi:hypothetical protein
LCSRVSSSGVQPVAQRPRQLAPAGVGIERAVEETGEGGWPEVDERGGARDSPPLRGATAAVGSRRRCLETLSPSLWGAATAAGSHRRRSAWRKRPAVRAPLRSRGRASRGALPHRAPAPPCPCYRICVGVMAGLNLGCDHGGPRPRMRRARVPAPSVGGDLRKPRRRRIEREGRKGARSGVHTVLDVVAGGGWPARLARVPARGEGGRRRRPPPAL